MNDLFYKMRKDMSLRSLEMFIRVTVQLKDLSKLEGNGPTPLYEPNYTGNHIAIFECPLKSPPSLSLIDHNYSDYINLHRLNFKNWKLVDIDHYMKGNTFFSQILSQTDFQKEFEKRMGAPESRTKVINDKDDMKEFD
jgi:hypothetical protein